MIYEHKHFFLLRKPRGVASSFGEWKSILDYFNNQWELETLLINKADFEYCLPYMSLDWLIKQADVSLFLINQLSHFSKEQEFGLVNRLDNDTGGFLYFAKTPEDVVVYKDLQAKHQIQKIYLAEVEGNPFYGRQETSINIDTPIMHHIQREDKMITLQNLSDTGKGRGKIHKVTTFIQLIHYNSEKNTSLLYVYITKGIRHQIRVHLSSIGSPILGDPIYNKKVKEGDLYLWSLGFILPEKK